MRSSPMRASWHCPHRYHLSDRAVAVSLVFVKSVKHYHDVFAGDCEGSAEWPSEGDIFREQGVQTGKVSGLELKGMYNTGMLAEDDDDGGGRGNLELSWSIRIYTGIYLRTVRTFAYMAEFFFKTSFFDAWNPWKVSRIAKTDE